MGSTLYDRDFHAWANEQAALLRAGQFGAADIENIAEEIESLGKGEKREMVRQLSLIMLHLLKGRYQPGMRGKAWETTIRVQRRDLARHLRDNPSLEDKLTEAITDAYGNALIQAAFETDLPEGTFPNACPWSFEEISAPDFWPA